MADRVDSTTARGHVMEQRSNRHIHLNIENRNIFLGLQT